MLLSFQVILWLVGLLFIIKYFQPENAEDDDNAVYDRKGKLIPNLQPFRVNFKSVFSKLLKMSIIVLIAAIIINQFIGTVIIVTPKPWYERLFISLGLTVAGGGAGGAIGGIIGASIGGIGIALMGTGVGIPGAIALGVIGFLGGALTGSVATNLSNPAYYNYSIDQVKLTLLIVGAITFGFIVVSIFAGLFNKLRQWLSAQPEKKLNVILDGRQNE